MMMKVLFIHYTTEKQFLNLSIYRYINQQWESCCHCSFLRPLKLYLLMGTVGGLVCDREMMGASSVDDVKACASKLLEVLENSVSKHVAEEAHKGFTRKISF